MSSTWTVEAIMLIQLDKWRNNAFFLWPCGCLDYITWREWSSTDKWTLSSCELVISWERSGGSLNCISFPWQCSQSNNKKRKRNSSFHQHKESLFSHDRTTQAIIIQSRQHIYLAIVLQRSGLTYDKGKEGAPNQRSAAAPQQRGSWRPCRVWRTTALRVSRPHGRRALPTAIRHG